MVEEGKLAARTVLQASLDAADSASHSICYNYNSWLQSSGLPPEVQQTIQDLSFESPSFFFFFLDRTDDRLHSLGDYRATLKSLGIYMPATKEAVPPAVDPQISRLCLSQDFSRKKQKLQEVTTTPPCSSTKGSCQPVPLFKQVFVLVENSLLVPRVPSTPSLFTNCLSHFLSAWSHINSDQWILNTVALGFLLPLPTPIPCSFSGTTFTRK